MGVAYEERTPRTAEKLAVAVVLVCSVLHFEEGEPYIICYFNYIH